MGYNVCTSVEGEKSTTIMKPGNLENTFAVAVMKKKALVGHLPKRKTGRFAKTIFFFLRSCHSNNFHIKVSGKTINQSDEKEMKVPCKLLRSLEVSSS